MRNRIQFGCVLNALDEIVGQLTRRATGAVSHADKIRHVRLKIANCLIERFRGLRRLWGKELERKRRRTSPHDFGDMHESALIFVPAATFGQAIRNATATAAATATTSGNSRPLTCLYRRTAPAANVSRNNALRLGSWDYFGE